MASSINLSRNTKVFFTTNVNVNTGVLTDSLAGLTPSNTFELAVLTGYNFGQVATAAAITVNEGGNTPTRGQRSFNTQLDAATWSFSTYIRPNLVAGVVSPAESVLWNAMFSSDAKDANTTTAASPVTMTIVGALSIARAATISVGASIATVTAATSIAGVSVGDFINIKGVTSAPSWNQAAKVLTVAAATLTVELFKAPAAAAGLTGTGTISITKGAWATTTDTTTGAFSYVSTMPSNKNQLQKFALIFVVDNTAYAVDNCVIDQVSIDFGLDVISLAAWTGKGTVLKQLTSITGAQGGTPMVAGTNYLANSSTANYITNRLSTMTLESGIGGAQNGVGSYLSYAIPVTGGNITIVNNTTYLIPTNLGVVNTPINYYMSTRSITGNVTAYLKTGTSAAAGGGTQGDAGNLLASVLSNISTSAETKYRIQLEMGGASNAVRVEFEMPAAMLQVPAFTVADVISTDIKFTAEGFTPDVNGASTPSYDLARTNELMVRYYSV